MDHFDKKTQNFHQKRKYSHLKDIYAIFWSIIVDQMFTWVCEYYFSSKLEHFLFL